MSHRARHEFYNSQIHVYLLFNQKPPGRQVSSDQPFLVLNWVKLFFVLRATIKIPIPVFSNGPKVPLASNTDGVMGLESVQVCGKKLFLKHWLGGKGCKCQSALCLV